MKKTAYFPHRSAGRAAADRAGHGPPAAELVRVFETGGVLYTYVSLTGSDRPITKAEAKLGRQSFPAAGTLETVRQAGFPVEYLLLVDNSNSMPPFREEVSAFAAALTEAGGTHTSYALATFGDQFVLRGESLTAETLAAGAASLSMDETVTRLNTSIAQALDHFEALPRTGNQLRCLVILSDGVQYDPQGGVPYDELVERLDRSDVMLYSVGLGGDSDALERMGALALTSWGLHWAVSDAQEAAQAADSLTRENGDLLVTSFDITAYRPAGGEEAVSVTFASGGELICRGAGTVRLSPVGEGDAAVSEPPPAVQTPENTAKPAAPAAEESKPEPSGLPVGIIAGGVIALAALAVLLCVFLRKKPPRPRRRSLPPNRLPPRCPAFICGWRSRRGSLSAAVWSGI